jgi:glycosyltransferase involved in cell wall biosynthesis
MAQSAYRPRISVIVPVYNGERTLDRCLGALLNARADDLEVIVVDDGSTDGTLALAEAWSYRDGRCRVVHLSQNAGAAQAKNMGARQAGADLLLFTDADIVVSPEVIDVILEGLDDDRVHGVVGLLGQYCSYGNFASQFKNLWMHYTYARQPREVGLFFTSVAAIRRELFLREGGFDDHYLGASITEDIEFGQRLRAKGYRLVLDKRAAVEHLKHYTVGEVLRTDLLRARGLTLTWLRNHLLSDGDDGQEAAPRAHYASVPWFFGAGVGAMGLAVLFLLIGILFGSPWLWLSLLAVLGALALNLPFLAALARWRGARFGVQSAGFLLLDLFASGLGIVLGMFDAVRGRRY